jgi:hypothetical protein
MACGSSSSSRIVCRRRRALTAEHHRAPTTELPPPNIYTRSPARPTRGRFGRVHARWRMQAAKVEQRTRMRMRRRRQRRQLLQTAAAGARAGFPEALARSQAGRNSAVVATTCPRPALGVTTAAHPAAYRAKRFPCGCVPYLAVAAVGAGHRREVRVLQRGALRRGNQFRESSSCAVTLVLSLMLVTIAGSCAAKDRA